MDSESGGVRVQVGLEALTGQGSEQRQQAGLRRLKSRRTAGGELAAFWKQRG